MPCPESVSEAVTEPLPIVAKARRRLERFVCWSVAFAIVLVTIVGLVSTLA